MLDTFWQMIEISVGHEEKLATNSFESFDFTHDRYRTRNIERQRKDSVTVPATAKQIK
jgi:hypothetical protein